MALIGVLCTFSMNNVNNLNSINLHDKKHHHHTHSHSEFGLEPYQINDSIGDMILDKIVNEVLGQA